MKYHALKIAASLLLIICSSILNAQDNTIDYYKSILNTSINDSKRLETLDSLCNKLYKTDTKQFIKYADLYVSNALASGHYNAALKKGVQLAHSSSVLHNDTSKSFTIIDTLKTYEKYVTKTDVLGDLYNEIGLQYFNGIDITKAIENFDIAISKYDSIKDKPLWCKSIYMKGLAYSYNGNFLKSIASYNKAYKIYEELNDDYFKIAVKSDIAALLYSNGIYNKAIEEHNRIIKITENNPEYHNLMFAILMDYSRLFRNNKEYNKEEEQLLKAERYLIQDDFYREERFTLDCALTTLYANKGDVLKAVAYKDKILKEEAFSKQNKETYEQFLNAITSYNISAKNYKTALKYATEHRTLAQNWKTEYPRLKAEEELFNTYEGLNDIKNAHTHQTEYYRLKDSLFNIQKTNTLLYYQTLFETSEKEKSIIKRENEIQLLKQSKRSSLRLALAGLFGIAFLFSVLFLLRKRQTLIREQKLQQNFTASLLKYQEDERKRVAEELHDGLGQNLMLIKNKMVLQKDVPAQKLVDNVINEVHHISQMLHPFQLEKLGLTQAIKSIIDLTNENSNVFVSSSINDLNNVFTKNQELNIYRVIQEILNNSIKHSKAEACRIEIVKTSNFVRIQIKDNGIGFNFSEEINKTGSLGLKTINERIRSLKGIINFNSTKQTGTNINIEIPL